MKAIYKMNSDAKPIRLESEQPIVTVKETENSCHYALSGSGEVYIEHLSSFDIQNIRDIESHQINRIFNSVSHHIKFVDGGEVKLSYSADGTLLEFWGKSVNIVIVDGERVIISKLPL